MEETPEQENARLLAPYIEARNAAAAAVLKALLDGRHSAATALLVDYQMAVLHVESAQTVCGWFDDGTVDEHVTIEFTEDPPAAGEA